MINDYIQKASDEIKQKAYLQGREDTISQILDMAFCSYDGMCMADKSTCLECHDYKIRYRDVKVLKEQGNGN